MARSLIALTFLLSAISLLAAPREEVSSYYQEWKSTYLEKSERVKNGSYVNYNREYATCSEAHGYGMLISLFMGAKEDFKTLEKYRKAFPSKIDDRLMAWQVYDRKDQPVKTTCATDGDLDMAYALLLASRKWNEPAYLKEALIIIKAMEESLVRKDFSLRRGDWDRKRHSVRLSDIMPTHFKAFQEVSNEALWKKVTAKQYEVLKKTMSEKGVFPDFVIKENDTWKPAPPNLLESKYDGMMYYNSCRVPWRLAWAVLEHDDTDAMALLKVFSAGIGNVPNHKFLAGYDLDGTPLNTWKDGTFTAPHMCSLLVSGKKKFFKEAWESQLTQKEGYFQDSVRLLCLILCEQHLKTNP